MGRWLFFSSGFHCLAVIFIVLFSGMNFNANKKQNKIFYVDFVGASVVSNAGAKGKTSPASGSSSQNENVQPKQEAKPDKNALTVPEKKEKPAEKKQIEQKKAEKNKNFSKIPVKKDNTKTASKKTAADKADYLEAEDFSGELPPPSMAAADGFLPEKKQISKNSSSGGNAGNGGEAAEGIGGGFRTDTDFPYPWYISQVREALFNAWAANSPSAAGLQCTAMFTILRNGSTKNAKIEKSSGNRLFDSAALAAVRAASPFSRLPDDFYEDVLTIHVEFRSTD